MFLFFVFFVFYFFWFLFAVLHAPREGCRELRLVICLFSCQSMHMSKQRMCKQECKKRTLVIICSVKKGFRIDLDLIIANGLRNWCCRLIPVLFGHRFRQGSWFHLGASGSKLQLVILYNLEQWVSGPKSDHTIHSPEATARGIDLQRIQVLGSRLKTSWDKVCHCWGLLKSWRPKFWCLWAFLVSFLFPFFCWRKKTKLWGIKWTLE